MTRTAYYVLSTFIGYFVAIIMGFLLGGQQFIDVFTMQSKFNSLIPIALGILTSLLVAIFIFGRKVKSESFFVNAIVAPWVIFMVGNIVGCFASFILHGKGQDIDAWLIKPASVINAFGVPACLVLGIILYFSLFKTSVKKTSA